MTTETPPDWVLLEAAKQSGWDSDTEIEGLRRLYRNVSTFRALCDMIQKYEKPPVDRKVLCAEQAIADWVQTTDDTGQEFIAARAIELWEEGKGAMTTEITPAWSLAMARSEMGFDIAAGSLAIDPIAAEGLPGNDPAAIPLG
jgi:hypothetical protein